MKNKIGILVGSLRKESYSKKLAKHYISIQPENYELEIIEIGDLALYNQDFDDENNPPETYTRFREKVKQMDAFLFITPEYNRSVPAVLKNALDVGSRPYGQNVWEGKPALIVSNSPGRLSAFGANHHLRQSLVFLDVYAMQQPELYLGEIQKSLDENGKVSSDKLKEILQNSLDAFVKWIEKLN